MLIYLAGPIDGVSEEVAKDWRKCFMEEAPLDWSFFDPCGAFTVQSFNIITCRNVSYINRQAICNSDVVLAWLAHGIGFGTIREIEFAKKNNMPVVAIVDDQYIGVEWWDVEQVRCIKDAIERIKIVT